MKNEFEIDTSNGTVKVGKTNAAGYDLSTSNGHITVEGKINLMSLRRILVLKMC